MRQKNHPAVGHFPPFGLLMSFSPYSRIFFLLDRFLYTIYDDAAPFQLSTKQGYDINSRELECKREGVGGKFVDIVHFVCFARMKPKQAERVMRFGRGDGANLHNTISFQLWHM